MQQEITLSTIALLETTGQHLVSLPGMHRGAEMPHPSVGDPGRLLVSANWPTLKPTGSRG